MRMNPSSPLTAKEIVNEWSEHELAKIFRELGEEPRWRRAAQAICAERKKHPISTTKELADLLVSTLGYRGKKRLHPATLIFQALRISVNDELGSIERALNQVSGFLSPGGRVGVISFHSLEDRIVKNIFRSAAQKRRAKRGQEEIVPVLQLLTKKPAVPSEIETRRNPRSRSAKLRFAEKVGGSDE